MLPFPDARFDVVLSTLMLHHLARKAREQCAREIRRVLRPNGRVLVVDFSVRRRTGKAFSRTSTGMAMLIAERSWHSSKLLPCVASRMDLSE